MSRAKPLRLGGQSLIPQGGWGKLPTSPTTETLIIRKIREFRLGPKNALWAIRIKRVLLLLYAINQSR
jgi:hypothetical protein